MVDETDVIQCMSCGSEGTTLTFHPAGTPILGHMVDMCMGVKWFCDPCFDIYRQNTHLRTKVHAFQDSEVESAKRCIRECSEKHWKEMETLPEGLKVTASDRRRCAELVEYLDDVTKLQSDQDNHLLHRICRNRMKTEFQHPRTGMRKKYDALERDFRNLEKLSPEARERLG